MKLAICGDLHLKLVEKYGKIESDGINSRLKDKLNLLNEIIDLSIEKDCKAFILLGDIFEHINPSERLRYLFVSKVLNKLIEKGVYVYILVGNHDTDNLIFSLMSEFSVGVARNWEIINRSRIIEFEGNCQIEFCPWNSQIQSQKSDILIAHDFVKGLKTEDNFEIREGFNLESLQRYNLVILGHCHIFQRFNNIVNLGSPFHIDYNDTRKKYFMIYSTNNLEYELVEVNDREFLTYNINSNSELDRFNKPKNNIIRVRLIGTRSWHKSFDYLSYRKKLLGAGAAFVFFERVYIEGPKKEAMILLSRMTSDLNLIRKRISNTDIKDKKTLEKIGIELITQARQNVVK